MKNWFKSGYLFWRKVIHEFSSGGYTHRAASLTFTSLLSLVPLMVVSLSILSAFPVFKGMSSVLQELAFKLFATHSAQAVQAEINKFIAQASKLPVPELLFLMTAALIMIFNMEQAFNAIWHVHKRRHGLSAFLLYWAVLTLSPLLMGSAFALGSYVISLPYIQATVNKLGLITMALAAMPTTLTFLTFTLLYLALPNRPVPWRCALTGGIFATVLFDIAKHGFTLYVLYFPTYQLVYGALATIPLFLIWVYFSWLIILLGAVVSYVMSLNKGAVAH